MWSLVARRGANVFILNKMGLRYWSLVGNKRWLLLGGSKCSIFVVVAIGGARYGLSREVGCLSQRSLIEVLLYNIYMYIHRSFIVLYLCTGAYIYID